jgi:hypothetical protein
MARDLRNTLFDEVLPRVSRPGQYAGGERNAIVKDHASLDIKVALAFPDTYAIGMSHLGLRILYDIINRRPDACAERVFAPWIDMEDELRRRELPLVTLESFTPLDRFDVIGFSMQYELGFTNLLNMLELARIPRLTAERSINDPVILGGGSITLAMEPVAPFFDAILVGDAEDVIHRALDTVKTWRRSGRPRAELHALLAMIPGMYVPSLYNIDYHADGTIARIDAQLPAPLNIPKTTVWDLENAPFPTHPVIPNVEVVHDRINIEIMRGCPNQCRFCQAVQHYRPLKMRSIGKVLELAEASFAQTGYDEISLTSLSTADYPGIVELLQAIGERFQSRRVNVSLPSLRVGPELKTASRPHQHGAQVRTHHGARSGHRPPARSDPQADQECGPHGGLRSRIRSRLSPGQVLLPDRRADRDRRGPARYRGPCGCRKLIATAHTWPPRAGQLLGVVAHSEAAHAVPVGSDGHARGADREAEIHQELQPQFAHPAQVPRREHELPGGRVLARRPPPRRHALARARSGAAHGCVVGNLQYPPLGRSLPRCRR